MNSTKFQNIKHQYKKDYFLITSIVVILALTLSWSIASSSPIVAIIPFLFFVAIWILLRWKIEYALWILIILSINVFGIFHGMSIPHFSLPGIGTFHLRDLVLLIMAIHAAHLFYSKRNQILKRSPLTNPLFALLCIIFLNSIIDIYQGINLNYLLRGWRHVAYYFVFFILINEIENKKVLVRFITGLMIIAVVTSVVAYLQFIFGWSFSVSKVEYMSEYGIYRTYQQGGVLVGLCFLLALSILLSGIIKSKRQQIFGWILICFFLGALLTSFARSSWGSMLLAILFIIILSRKKVFRATVIIIPIFLITSYLANSGVEFMTDRSLIEILKLRSMSGIEDLIETKGTFYNRLLILQKKWQTVRDENIILGIGFDSAVPISSSTPTNAMVNIHPRALVVDSSLPNILLLFGFSGVFIFLWILASFFYISFSLWNKLPFSLDRAIILGCIAFNIQIIFVSFFGDRFTNPFSVSILTTSWAIVVLISRFVLQQKQG